MDNKQLQMWVEQVSLASFGVPFKHLASFNHRLRATGGRYFMKTHHIEISSLQLQMHGPEEVEKIIKHELCHYHLHLARRGHQHRDADFKQLLQQVGGTRYCRSVQTGKKNTPYRYRLVCANCKMEYMRKRKVNPAQYACGKCRGKLKLYTVDFIQQS